jgi:hypothetical protein
MGWFDRILDAVQTAAIIGERVEKLGQATEEMARDLRQTEQRLARLEGYCYGKSQGASQNPKLPRPKP